jgi:hypothetical protein
MTADSIVEGWRNIGDVAPQLLSYAKRLEEENGRLRHAVYCVSIGKPYTKRAAALLRELGESTD